MDLKKNLFFIILSSMIIFHFPLLASVDKKIQSSQKKLNQTKKAYANMDRKLSQIAKKIKKNKSRLKDLDKILKSLEEKIEKESIELKEGEKRLNKIELDIKKLKKEQDIKSKELIELLSSQYILNDIKMQKNVDSLDDVIENELLGALAKLDSKRITVLKSEYEQILRDKDKLTKRAENLKNRLSRLKEQKKKAAKERVKRVELQKKLNRQKKEYQARLIRLQKEEKSLRKTLANLKIIKRREEKADAEISKRIKEAIKVGDKLKVRTIGSSYQKHSVSTYKGKKTISPVGKAKVVKRFGAYLDPIYNIKIFNESVTLRPYKKNAKVKNVLNGKVVFAKDTKLLGKVVIVEHKNNLHTIYAKMSKIAPTIKEGMRIKKGTVIGRVEKELMFEVTQKELHINPLELIKVN